VAPCQSSRFWVTGEYLLWWIKDGPLPAPLVTTGSAASVTSGFIGSSDTRVLLGGGHMDYGTLSGGRLTAGLWLSDDHALGLEASGFGLEQGKFRFAAASDATGTPVLVRPFGNPAGAEDGARISFPGALAGSVRARSTSRLWGVEANAATTVSETPTLALEGLLGFRYLKLQEKFDVAQNTQILAGGFSGFDGSLVFAGNGIAIADNFNTRNQFYGGQLGARARYCRDWLTLDLLGKVALGSTHETLSVAGSTTLFPPAVPSPLSGSTGATTPASTTVPGGLLALPSNSGRHQHDAFSVVPELGINIGVQATRNVRAFAGYSFLYWSDVARVGDQIPHTLNQAQIPTSPLFGPLTGPALPAAGVLQHKDFWAQGLDFGLELSF
jgi:hypothetical protein